MPEIYFSRLRRFKDAQQRLEDKLGIRFYVRGKKVNFTVEDTVKSYEAEMILEALNFGFDVESALMLTDEDVQFRKLPIKSFTRRKNMEEVRGRIIGKEGKSRRTVEQISGCAVIVGETEVAIIGSAENIDAATTGVINLIRGSKHSNVYHYLEQSNTRKKQAAKDDLGLTKFAIGKDDD